MPRCPRRLGFLIHVCLCFAELSNTQAENYTHGFCKGVISFDLASTANTTSLDTAAQDSYNSTRRWFTQSCLTAVWKLSCMRTYGSYASDGTGYCYSSCVDTIEQCSETLAALGDLASVVEDEITLGCELYSGTNTGCHGGGSVSYADIPEGWGSVCPLPMNAVQSHYDGGSSKLVSGTSCALPCPSIIFTHSEYTVYRETVRWITFGGGVAAAVVVIFYRSMKSLFIQLLCYTIVVGSAAVFFFLLLDDYDSQTCAGEWHFYEYKPFCVLQATVTVFTDIWKALLLSCIVVSLWASVVLKMGLVKLKTLQQRMLWMSCGWAALSTVACLAGMNLGYDWKGYSGPVCLFLGSKSTSYFWATAAPPYILAVLMSLGLMMHTIYHINRQMSSSTAISTLSQKLCHMYNYNSRMVLFTAFFTCLAAYRVGLAFNAEFAPYHPVVVSLQDYIVCLLEHTHDQTSTGLQACGDRPSKRPPLWQLLSFQTVNFGIGVSCWIVYGTQGKLTTVLRTSLVSFRLRRGSSAASDSALITGPQQISSKRDSQLNDPNAAL